MKISISIPKPTSTIKCVNGTLTVSGVRRAGIELKADQSLNNLRSLIQDEPGALWLTIESNGEAVRVDLPPFQKVSYVTELMELFFQSDRGEWVAGSIISMPLNDSLDFGCIKGNPIHFFAEIKRPEGNLRAVMAGSDLRELMKAVHDVEHGRQFA